jgi:1,2-dihydroxy-3-keto-5-methylthiopentene dioxygenase
MSILKLENGQILYRLSDIQQELATLDIQINHYNLETTLTFPDLLVRDVFSQQDKQKILQSHNKDFELLQQQAGYFSYDLWLLHPGLPNLYALIATHSRYHTHQDAEAMCVLAGEGLFGFARPRGDQLQLQVQPGDYIHIPAGVEHWFSLSASLHLKAWRYFTSADGWVPQYTSTGLEKFLKKKC